MPTYPRPFAPDSFVWMGSKDITLPPLWLGALRLLAKLAVIGLAAWGIHLVMDWATTRAAGNDSLMFGVLALLLLAYALLIAIPFMPGIEIGISLLVLEGAAIAPLVYGATVLGLMLAFAAGRLLPHAWLRGLLADFRLKRACLLVDRLAPMSGAERLAHLAESAPAWLSPLIGPWRYLLLAALINIPGSAVIGGGGGIAFTAGFSRLFRPGWTALTFALAVAPVPLIVWLSGGATPLR
jgi:hypothetical protein